MKRLPVDKTKYVTAAQNGERIASECICCGCTDLSKSPAILMPFIAKRAFGWEPVEITDDWGLRDIKRGMAYPLCNSMQCERCGLVFLDIRFSESEMASLYTGYRRDEYTALRDKFEPGYAERNVIILRGATHVPKIETFLSAFVTPPLRILDWGGDTGFNTPFRSQNALLHIYDISNQPVVEGAVRVDTDTVKHTNYDLIVLMHVIEHVPYPARTISAITAVMKEDTVLYVEVPHEDVMRLNQGSKEVHKKKKYWHEHINFYTCDSLMALLGGCGLRAIGAQSIEAEGGGKNWHVFSIACKLQGSPRSEEQLERPKT